MKPYREVVQYLESLGVMPKTAPSLEPIKRAIARANLKSDPSRNIIIAGTNGKGSVAATLSALLHSAGARVGLYTSPHLVTTKERFRICEEDISEDLFVKAFEAVEEIIQQEKLSYFEALTLMGVWIFTPMDWTIWEVGLGGRWDATNAISHNYCAITRLGLDHQGLLGNTLEEIALEKFGVISEGADVVFSPMTPEIAALRAEVHLRTKCRWIRAAAKYRNVETPLVGPRAAENTATSLTVFQVLGFKPEEHLESLSRVRWPGRFQKIAIPKILAPVFLSGDHNVQGIESLIEILQGLEWETLHLVVGVGEDKDVGDMLGLLFELPRSRIYLTETPFKTRKLKDYPNEALTRAQGSNPDVMKILRDLDGKTTEKDLVVVTGSLYLVGKVLSENADVTLYLK